LGEGKDGAKLMKRDKSDVEEGLIVTANPCPSQHEVERWGLLPKGEARGW